MRVTKQVDFAAAHSIRGAGQCANKHGHNWRAIIEVDVVGGEITDERNFVINVRELKDTAFKYDHDDLDKYFDWASTENVAQQIADDSLELCEKANPEALFMIRVHLDETENNSADTVASNAVGELNRSDMRLVGLKGAHQDRQIEPDTFGEGVDNDVH